MSSRFTVLSHEDMERVTISLTKIAQEFNAAFTREEVANMATALAPLEEPRHNTKVRSSAGVWRAGRVKNTR
jgi:hypothetical protein